MDGREHVDGNAGGRPVMAQRCPKPWTPADDLRFQMQLDLLREDIRVAGGLSVWLETRLEGWLVDREQCPAARSLIRGLSGAASRRV